MTKTKKKVIAFIAIFICFVMCSSGFILTLAVTVAASEIQTLLIAMEDEEPFLEDVTEEPAEDEKLELEPEEGTYFDALHKKILMTDIDSIPDNANYIDPNDSKVVGISGLSVRAYLHMYKLAAEICLREEINPKDAEVTIYPMDLIGQWMTEFWSSDYSSLLSEGTLVWIPEEKIQRETSGGFATFLKQQPLLGATPTLEGDMGVCVSFFGQMLWYNYNQDVIYSSHTSIYISTDENPDLESNKRVIWGTRENIYNGEGLYLTGDLWKAGGKSNLSKAPYSEIKGSISNGVFDVNTAIGYGTRPATYFLPDSMYTHALSIRCFLQDYADGSLSKANDATYNTAKFKNLVASSLTTTDSRNIYSTVAKMYVLTRFLGDGNMSNFAYANKSGEASGIAQVYAQFVKKGIDPLAELDKVENKNPDVRKRCISYPAAACKIYIEGNEAYGGGEHFGSKYQFDLGYASISPSPVTVIGAGNHGFYGFDCITKGQQLLPAFTAQVNGAYDHYGKKIQHIVPESIPGLLWPLEGTSAKILADGFFGGSINGVHYGIDILAKQGAVVYAAADGKIVSTEPLNNRDAATGSVRENPIYGVLVEYGDATVEGHVYTLQMLYTNVSSLLHNGTAVKRGDKIGTVSEYSTEGNGCPGRVSQDSYLHLAVILRSDESFDNSAGFGSRWDIMVPEISAANAGYKNPWGFKWFSKEGVVVIIAPCEKPEGYDTSNEFYWDESYNSDGDSPAFSRPMSQNYEEYQRIVDIIVGVSSGFSGQLPAWGEIDVTSDEAKKIYEDFAANFIGFPAYFDAKQNTSFFTKTKLSNGSGNMTSEMLVSSVSRNEPLKAYPTKSCDGHNNEAKIDSRYDLFYDSGWQCWGFAYFVLDRVAGKRTSRIAATLPSSGNAFDFLTGCPPGTYVRDSGNRHSYVVLGGDDTHVVLYDCNIKLYTGASDCGIRLAVYTKDQFNRWTYGAGIPCQIFAPSDVTTWDRS